MLKIKSDCLKEAFNKNLQDEEYKLNSVSQRQNKYTGRGGEGSAQQMKSDVCTTSLSNLISFSLKVSHGEIRPKSAIRQWMVSS